MSDALSTTLRDDPRTVQDVSGVAPAHDDALLEGTLGRYRIDGLLGQGGMGAVYRGHDPNLDRVVALKVIRHAETNAMTEARFRREAKTMAALNHPNVVRVFDVDSEGRRAFIAMEYVDGTDAKAWLKERQSTRDVLRVFTLAGRGLAAAHDAGLIHRDFKPANVLLGADGRVAVSDFGLARVFDAMSEPSEATADYPPRHVLDDDLTATGTAMGTLAYMAPEVIRGQSATPLSDQYSFCVALYEAVCGGRPLGTPDGSEVQRPRWLREALRRGLQAHPDARWPDMHALLGALQRRRRPPWPWLAGGGVAAAAATVAAFYGTDETRACDTVAERLTDVWRGRQGDIVAHATEAPSAAASDWGRAEQALDQYVERWVEERAQICRTVVTSTEADLDLQLRCLDRRAVQFESLLNALADGPSTGVIAGDAVAGLRGPDTCRDIEALHEELRTPEDPEDARRAERLRYLLAEVSALISTRQLDKATEQARAAVAEAEAIGFAPLIADANNALGDVLYHSGDVPGSTDAYGTAYFTAEAADHPAAAFESARQLVSILADGKSEIDRAEEWSRHAGAMLERLPGDTRRQRSLLARSNSTLALRRDDFVGAAELMEQTIAYRTERYGPSSRELVDPLFARANIHLGAAELTEAKALLDRIYVIVDEELGDEHPMMAEWYRMTAYMMTRTGDYGAAKSAAARSLQIAEAAHGRDHYLVGQQLVLAAHIATRMNDNAEALLMYDRAIAIDRKQFGASSSNIATLTSGRADVLANLGRFDDAAAAHREALDLAVASDNSASTQALLNTNAALSFASMGATEDARKAAARALELVRSVPEKGDLEVNAHWVLGAVELIESNYEAARDQFELVNLAWFHRSPNPIQAAYTRLLLARALWQLGEGERDRATALGLESVALLRPYGDNARRELNEAEAWVAEHAPAASRTE